MSRKSARSVAFLSVPLVAGLATLGCDGPPLRYFSIEEVGAFSPSSQHMVISLMSDTGEAPNLEGSSVTVAICERSPGQTPGCTTRICGGELSLTGVSPIEGRASLDVPLTGACRRAGPGLAGDVVVGITLPDGNHIPSVARLGPPELQGEAVAVPVPVPPPPIEPVAPPVEPVAIAGTVVAPHPLVLAGIEATLGQDPADPDAVVVRGPGCEVRIAAPSMVIDGARSRAMLEGIGATFTTSELAPDRWALAYSRGDRFSIQHGLVTGGRTYVCRGDYPSVEAQGCGAALCRTLQPTGGAAAAPASGPIVAHCIFGAACNQARADDRDALAMSCGIVAAPLAEGACPSELTGAARLGLCVTSSGTEWVYYAAANQTRQSADAQCRQLGGALTP